MLFSQIHIACFDTKDYTRQFLEEANQSPEFGFEFSFFESRLTIQSVRMAEGADVVCSFVNDELNAAVIRNLGRLGVRLIALRCTGLNRVDLATAEKYGISVVRVPAYSPAAIAEYTLGLLLTLNRNIHLAFNRVREHNFSIAGFMGFDLRGKTIGIVGAGKIGLAFSRLLQGFGVRILAFDPIPNPVASQKLEMDYVPLDWLLEESDAVSIHCPLTPESRRLIRKETLQRMKTGATLLNTSHWRLIDVRDVTEALKSGKLSRVGLDVYEEENEYFTRNRSRNAASADTGKPMSSVTSANPAVPINPAFPTFPHATTASANPAFPAFPDASLEALTAFPNVIVSSHQAFFTKEALESVAQTTLQNIADFFRNEELVKEEKLAQEEAPKIQGFF